MEKQNGFFLNCCKGESENKMAVQDELFSMEGLGGLFSASKLKWVAIGVGIYVVTTKFGLLKMLFGKDKKK